MSGPGRQALFVLYSQTQTLRHGTGLFPDACIGIGSNGSSAWYSTPKGAG